MDKKAINAKREARWVAIGEAMDAALSNPAYAKRKDCANHERVCMWERAWRVTYRTPANYFYRMAVI